jgi:(2R)-ethylmalonyl-CoA mutase
VQLPAWNEALGLPRPWDQQWSLRLQQIVAYETDLLDYADIFDGSSVIAEKVEALKLQAREELAKIDEMGGAVVACEAGYMKRRLVESNATRLAAIESGEQTVVGVNRFTETEPSPLGGEGNILKVDPAVEAEMIADVQAWRAGRDATAVQRALDDLRRSAEGTDNIMPPTIALALAGGTTGEWAGALREVFGEYRAPTGVSAAVGRRPTELAAVAAKVKEMPGGPPKLLVAKPGLDGHSNGAEQIAVAARDAGMEVVYSGIRMTPEQIAASARDEDPDVVGLSILSGSHLELVPTVVRLLQDEGVDAPVVVGGIIPEDDRPKLLDAGVAAVYTPKDFELARIMDDIAGIARRHREATPA